ncbi:MAG TPA: glycosyltransferase family 2 protein [Chitinophagaceae bacterium]|nr:glycosyltransferase family 2 protein [Chitinophagaceae bacterium]
MATIGLVTVLFRSDEVLPDFFKSISRQTHKDYILYLVDNSESATTDAIISQCLKEYPVTAYRHIKTGGNIGVAAGNNTGIKLSLADNCSHVLILNNDIEIEQDFMFSKLLSLADADESMIVPKIYYYDEKKIWMAGGYMDKWRALGVHYGYNQKDKPKYNIGKHVTYSPTCFMLVKKEVFDATGIMDEKYFAYYDDTDFVLRATKLGYKIWYEPSLELLHKVSSSVGTNSPFYVYYSNRNKIYFIRKNFKGLQRYFALLYTLISRIAFWVGFDKARKQKLVQGLKDGFKMKWEQGH